VTAAITQTWRALPTRSRRWIFWQFVVGAAVVNAVLSAALAWFFTLEQDGVEFSGVPLVDKTTVLADSIGTLFVLPFLTTMIVTTVVRRELEHGELEVPAGGNGARLPSRLPWRAAYLGMLCLAALALPITVALLAAGSPDMTIGEFVAYKAAFGVAYGLIVTPPVALLAMATHRAVVA
jgi:hypothetical protein